MSKLIYPYYEGYLADWTYSKAMLPKVSRTFSLVISILTGDKHKSILLAYLLCRIADTIEDNYFLKPDRKFELLDKFVSALKNGTAGSQTDLQAIEDDFKPVAHELPDYDLTAQVRRVIRAYETLPVEIKHAITPWIEEMAIGMKKFQRFSQPSQAITAIRSVEELNDYCYYVAGTVGMMLTDLFILFAPRISLSSQEKMRKLAVSFGLGLQMTNIIKDVNVDLHRGWCYYPEPILKKHGLTPETLQASLGTPAGKAVVREMKQITFRHLQDALDYTTEIPWFERQIRLFCLWPLHMANQTLAAINDKSQLFSGGTVKITRHQVQWTILRTSIDWFSNQSQRSFFKQYQLT